ncbi:hypothetical protein PIB30_008104 [Stylosanthes scabra]|uniref:Protein kinase domain-containing protein n=1 Tax=Stylosanthes scabra TaxID=79078 RepID=A0ABU6X265_9FABA|nr:hypothetical protein [Stylosanthes scabra]
METLLYHKLHASVSAVLFLLLLQFHSLAYTLPDEFFINCGSDTNVTDRNSGRIFIGEREGEMESSSVLPFIFPKHGTSKEKENNNSPTPTPTPPLYQTARLFHAESEYNFRIENHGYHLLRLHFFAFSSSKGNNLSSAHFNVSVPGFCLLNNFTPQNMNKPIIEEFFLIINTDNFQITFSPILPNLAFINAIELFLLPINSPHKYAYLNGLELMKIIEKNTSSGPMVKEEQSHHHSHSHWHCPWHMCVHLKLLAILGAVALVSVIAVVFLVCLKLIKKPKHDESVDWLPMEKKEGRSSHSHSRYGSSHGSSSSSSYSHVPNLNKIRFEELQVATNNFDQNWVIGKGCFGTVYKGLLNNGLRVAVKRLQQQEQGLLDMEEEIKILLRIRHRHLVSLMGYCYERSEMILVYEFMEKGTLRDHIKNSSLCWIQRLEICIGAARGLNYLHNGSSCRGINNVHSHVKSSNILLDENNVAKISGFGLSRKGAFHDEKMKCDDVYSFGVVLVEVVCGRVGNNLGGEWGSIWKKKGRLEEIVDPCIKCEIDGKSLRKFGETIDKCLRNRPCMGDVLWDLEYALQLQRGAIQTKTTHTHGTSSATIEKPTTQEMAILKHDQLNSSALNYYSVL